MYVYVYDYIVGVLPYGRNPFFKVFQESYFNMVGEKDKSPFTPLWLVLFLPKFLHTIAYAI